MTRLDPEGSPVPTLIATIVVCSSPTLYALLSDPQTWPVTRQVLGIGGSIALLWLLLGVVRFGARLPGILRALRDVATMP